MDERSQSHATWDCKYHVVFASKYRTKRLYGDLRRELGDLLHTLAGQKGCRIEEGHLMPDHVHMLISIPPKYSVSHIIGFLKGKTAIYVANKYARKRRYKGYHFWARGYFVSTTGYSNAGTVAFAVGKGVVGTLAQRYIGQTVGDLIDQISDHDESVVETAASEGLSNGRAALTKLTDEITDKLIASFHRETGAIDGFKANVTATIERASDEFDRKLPLFVVVDELDRCRPTYAVKMLERIKHMFETDNVVFLIATDTTQLRHSIRGTYGGDFDGMTYLQRFFDRTYVFRESDQGNFLQEALEQIDTQKMSFPTKETIVFLRSFSSHFSLSLREFKKVLEIVENAVSAWSEPIKIEAMLLFPLAATFVRQGDCSFEIPLARSGWQADEDVFLGDEYRARSSNRRKYSLSTAYTLLTESLLVSVEKATEIQRQDPEGRYVRDIARIEFNSKETGAQQRAGSVQNLLPGLVKSAARLI